MFLEQSFSHSKWVLQAILSLTVLSNCVSGSTNFDIIFLADCTKSCSLFMLLDWKFNKVSKNVLKTVIFSLQVGFTSDLSLNVLSKAVQILTPLFFLTVPNCVVFFQVIE